MGSYPMEAPPRETPRRNKAKPFRNPCFQALGGVCPRYVSFPSRFLYSLLTAARRQTPTGNISLKREDQHTINDSPKPT